MGLLNDLLGGQEDEQEEDDISADFEDEFDEGVVEETKEQQEEITWDDAADFAEFVLEKDGFTSLDEFARKAMMYRINRSPIFRDRIANGVQTMDMITDSMGQLKELREGGEKEQRNYREMAQQLQAANDVIDEVDRLGGKEDQIVNEALGIGQELVGALAQRGRGGGARTGTEVDR